ncbi:MAG: hypothetical protein ACOCYW_09155, partial [Roseicyclus sp.]
MPTLILRGWRNALCSSLVIVEEEGYLPGLEQPAATMAALARWMTARATGVVGRRLLRYRDATPRPEG